METVLLAAAVPPRPVESWRACLPPARAARLSPSLPPARLSAVLTAYALLRKGAMGRLGWPALPEVAYTPAGRPYFPEIPGLFFSLSHTGGCAACLLSDRPAGVDVERPRAVSRRLRERMGTAGELDFFRLWTAREALLKLTGEGSPLRPVPRPGASLRHYDERGFLFCAAGEGPLPPAVTWIDDLP